MKTIFEQAFMRLGEFIQQKMKVFNIPAVAVAVTDRNKLLHEFIYGLSDVSAQVPNTPHMLFEIGSIGKSFTSIALLQLREEGRLDLHEPVTRYLPWFEVKSQHEPITLHHLLSHTAGIIRGEDFPGDPNYEVWALRATEATAPPGEYYHYSNSGYKTLGVVLEEQLRQSYADIIQGRILDPLGMSATVPIVTNETRPRLAVGYEGFYDDRPIPPGRPLAPATWLEHAEGAGSIASTATDMAVYLRMLLNQGQGSRKPILSKESFELMTQPVIEAQEEGKGSYYGYGLETKEVDGHTYISHGGGMVGYYSYIMLDMDDGLGIVVLMNGPGEQSDEEIAMFGLKLLRSALRDQVLPDVPCSDLSKIENASEYSGTYRIFSGHDHTMDSEQFTLMAENGHLILHYGSERITLERRGRDSFYVDHPSFALFLLRFGRQNGQIVEAFHGLHWYTKEGYTGPKSFDYPQEWDAYPGHYRSHNPWFSNFRIILRKGRLTLVDPSGEEGLMAHLGDSLFRVGEDDRSPERISFDAIINNQALRAYLSGSEYYRTFTT